MFTGTNTKNLLVILAVALGLTACTPTPEETSTEDAKSLVESIVYVKAKNGLCFGVSTTSRLDTGGKLSMTNQLVNIPCSEIKSINKGV